MSEVSTALAAVEEPYVRVQGLATAVRLLGELPETVDLERRAIGELGRAIEGAADEIGRWLQAARMAARPPH